MVIDEQEVVGFIKRKGTILALSPEKFLQMEARYISLYLLIKKNIFGYCATSTGQYWVLCKEKDGKYFRVPFAKNHLWFKALTAEFEYRFIKELPQIYIIGLS